MHPVRPLRYVSVLSAVFLAASGCAQKLTGPSPATKNPAAGQSLPVDPGILCRDQLTTDVVVHGSGFSPVPVGVPGDTKTELPTITLLQTGALDGSGTGGAKLVYDGKAGGANAGLLSWQSQQQMTFTVNQALKLGGTTGPMDPGMYDVQVTNPDTDTAKSQGALAVAPKPTVASLSPGITCLAQGSRDVTLTGTTYLQIDGATPTVTAGGQSFDQVSLDGCKDIPQKGMTAQACTSAKLTLPNSALDPGTYDLVLDNPDTAACHSEETANLVVAAPPSITQLLPSLACTDQGDRQVEIDGTGFLVIDGTSPTVTLGGTALTVTATGGCTDVTVTGSTVQSCTTLTVTVPQQTNASPVAPDITVTNPDPAGCNATASALLVLVPAPTVTDVQPPVVCDAGGASTLTVTGTDLLTVDGTPPTVTLNGTAADPAMVSATGCTDLSPMPPGHTVQTCTGLTVDFQGSTITTGQIALSVANPDPAGCSADWANPILIAPSPAVTSVSPSGVCSSSPSTQVTISGSGFLSLDGTLPTVVLTDASGTTYSPTPDGVSGCTAITVSGATNAQSCNTMQITVPQNALAQGDVSIEITNPGPGACNQTATGVFYVNPQPTVTSAAPTEFCADLGGSIDITGTGFSPGSQVSLMDSAGNSFAASSVTFTSATDITADFAPNLTPGSYSLTVDNGPSCSASYGPIVVDPKPFVFFIDPPEDYNGIAIQATVYTTGLTAAASSVDLVDSSGNTTTLTGSSVPGEPNRIFVTIPSGLTPGVYDIQVTSQTGCVGSLVGGLTVTATPTVAIQSIAPSYVSTNLDTAVTIKAVPDPLPAGQVDFQQTPRAYLNPVTAGSGTVASALRAVVWNDNKTLTAVVPKGLPPGDYDLIVVNPDSSVGVLANSVHITANDPPIITAVVPGSLDDNTATPVAIQGQNFDATNGVLVDVTCKAPAAAGGATYTGSAVVTSTTTTTVDASFDPTTWGSPPDGSICVVRVTNGDGAFFDYSAISVKNPSQNLYPWAAAPAMVEPREGLGLAAGRPTYTSRYVYAVGGDDPAAGGAKTSVESANVDVFGQMSAWSLQRNSLPAARTMGGLARIGHFLYLVGGDDGTGSVTTVYRAQILDPLATPTITDLSLSIGDMGAGFGAGFWYYRISATFPGTDADNPGGESLPGEVQVVQLPATNGIQLSLTWDPIPGANGYRIYRTAQPNLSPSDVELVATINGGSTTTWLDTGATPDPTQTPLPPGSLGVWHDAGVSLGTPREALAVIAGDDPAGPNDHVLYAFGGATVVAGPPPVTTKLDTFEYFTVTVQPPSVPKGREDQTITAHSLGTALLAAPRSELGAWTVTHADKLQVPAGTTWVYVGPGAGATGDVSNVEAATIPAGGDITAFAAQKPVNSRTGSGYAHGNGFLFLFGGGTGGTASSGGISAEICPTTGCGSTPPTLHNWNALGTSLSEARVFMGTAQESAFFFVAGGFNGTTVTNSVDQTVK